MKTHFHQLRVQAHKVNADLAWGCAVQMVWWGLTKAALEAQLMQGSIGPLDDHRSIVYRETGFEAQLPQLSQQAS